MQKRNEKKCVEELEGSQFLIFFEPRVFFGDVFSCLGISFLHSKNKIEACDYEVEKRRVEARARVCTRCFWRRRTRRSEAKTSKTATARPETKKKNLENKTIFSYVFINSLSLSLPLTLPNCPPVCCRWQEPFCAQRSKDIIAKKTSARIEKKKHTIRASPRKKKNFISLSTLSQFSLPLFQFCFLKLETDTLVGKTKENPPLSLSVSLFLPVFFFLIEGKKKRGEIIISI